MYQAQYWDGDDWRPLGEPYETHRQAMMFALYADEHKGCKRRVIKLPPQGSRPPRFASPGP